MKFYQILLILFATASMVLSFSSCKKDTDSPTQSGDKYINLSLPDTSGNTLSISDLEGKYILIEFWASWCGPCRAENPNLVSLHNQYKDKNFTIYGVSLDTQYSNWKNAIEDDMLDWPNVSDLQGWNAQAVAAYNVQFTPSNFLVDPDGFIIATNLKGTDLANKLSELLD